MAEDQSKKDEELEFTPEGEALGYISLDQARVLAMRTTRETPGAYGRSYADVPMAFDVVETAETEDHYVITLSFRPQGEFDGRAGLEQFFIEKEGNVAHRQVLSLPRRRRRIPLIAAVGGLALVVAVAVGVSIGITRGGGDGATSTANDGLLNEPVAPSAAAGPASTTATQLPSAADIATPESFGSSETQQIEPSDSAAIDPLVSDAGLEYAPVRYSGGLEVLASQRVAQSFTVPSDGLITGVELVEIGIGNCPVPEDLRFRLLATVDGFPGKPSFYSAALPHGAFVPGVDDVRIDFPEAVSVGAFQTLALELSNPADPTAGDNCFYGWSGENPGTYQGGQAFSSVDGGQTWLADRKDLAFRVFFQADSPSGISGSTNASLATRDLLNQPWRHGRLGDEPDEPWNERIRQLTLSTDHSTMYAHETQGCLNDCRLYRSPDRGRTWWPIMLPFSWSGQLALRAVGGREIYAWSDTMMWRSLDGGLRWIQLDTPTGLANPGVSPFIRAMAVSPEAIFIATADQNSESGGLFQSQDKGASWRLISGWVPGITHLSVAGEPATIYMAWRAGDSNGLQWSFDFGRSWHGPRDEATGKIANWWISDFSLNISNPATIYAAVAGKGLLSIDDLNPQEYTVLWASDTVEKEVLSVATHPNNPGVLAIRTTTGLLATLDG